MTHYLSAIALSAFFALPLNAQTEKPLCIESNGKKNDCLKIESVKPSATNFSEYLLTFRATRADGRTDGDIDLNRLTVSINGKEPFTPSKEQFSRRDQKTFSVRIVLLLDYSGSMANKIDKTSDLSKLEQAVDGARNLIASLPKDANVKISVVPFAIINEKKCKDKDLRNRLLFGGNPKSAELLNSFYTPESASLSNLVNGLGDIKNLCDNASTNLFEALALTMDFLANQDNKDLYPDEKEKRPTLAIFLLTDGFNTEPLQYSPNPLSNKNLCERNEQYLKTLKQSYLTNKKYEDIRFYSFGYGRTDSSKFKCQDVYWGDGPAPQGQIRASEFVEDAFGEIINQRGYGFSAVFGDTQGLTNAFEDFKEAIFGEYNITFLDPEADGGERRNVSVSVSRKNPKLPTLSDIHEYSGSLYPPTPFAERLPLLGGGALFLAGVSYLIWKMGLTK